MLRSGLPEPRESCGYSRSRREPLQQLSAIEPGFMMVLLHDGPLQHPDKCQYLIDTTQVNSPICLRQVPSSVSPGSWISRWNKKCICPMWRKEVS
jgi:hypothetical protein